MSGIQQLQENVTVFHRNIIFTQDVSLCGDTVRFHLAYILCTVKIDKHDVHAALIDLSTNNQSKFLPVTFVEVSL